MRDLALPYLMFSIVLSLWQGYRGFVFQHQFAKHQKAKADESDRKAKDEANRLSQQAGNPVREYCPGTESTLQLVLTRSLADAWLYFASSLIGFAALYFAVEIVIAMPAQRELSIAKGTLGATLVAIAIVGVTGQGPNILQQLDKMWPFQNK